MCAFEYLKSQGVENVVVADISSNCLEKAEESFKIADNADISLKVMIAG